MKSRAILLSFLAIVYWTSSAAAQLLTGSVVGSVADSSGSAIPGVTVTVVSEATLASHQAKSDEGGNFEFNAIPPGMYTLVVESQGFKKYERTGIELPPNEHLSVGEVRLQIGGTAEQVTVVAEGTAVQTASGERSGVISSEQIQDLTIVNRDFSALVALQPGVVQNPGQEVQGFGGDSTFNVLGGRTGANNISIDGVPSDNSNGTNINTFISMDSVAAVKILVSNFQAEFGRKPGAGIMAVTKSGTQKLHGTAYWYQRNEALNATDFFNNRNGVPKPVLRYLTGGFNIGGRISIPKIYSSEHKKLFFFFSTEQIRERRPQTIRQITMPTALERQGDFSPTVDLSGRRLWVRDPGKVCNSVTGGPGCFPGNVIPPNQINSLAQKYLNLLPMPNFFNTATSGGKYNYQIQESLNIPKNTEIVRIDYHLSPNTTIYGRLNYWWEDITGFATPAGNSNWGWLPNDYNDVSRTLTLSASHVFGPSVVFEASMGLSYWTESSKPGLTPQDVQRLNRTTSGINIPQFNPADNPLNLVPQARFGGSGLNETRTQYATRFPIHGRETIATWNGVFTRVHNSHASKAGLYAEQWWENKGPESNFAGEFDFRQNSSNPNDANYTWANALLGNFVTYSEASTRPTLVGRVTGVEWFLQDNWKVSRRLTLDYGARLGWSQPFHAKGLEEAGFVPTLFNPSNHIVLIQPRGTGSQRVGINPLTGQVLPAAMIGAIVPGFGDPYDGTVNRKVTPSYPSGLRKTSGIKTAPRFGFAYKPFHHNKTVIRGGAGVFYEVHERDNLSSNIWTNPPLVLTPEIFYGNLNTFSSQAGFNFPSNTTGFDLNRPLLRTVNFSFELQQDIGFGTVVGVSYVGALSRHLVQRRNLNSVPFGTTFLPSSKEPSNPSTTLASEFLRPYLGYGDIEYYQYSGNANYHSLQVKANRFSRGLNYGLAWTWSKAMDYTDSDGSDVSNLIDPKVWNYGKSGFDHTHILKAYGDWNLPRASRVWDAGLARKLLDDWTLSGITTFQSGAPLGIGVSFTGVSGQDITGSPTDGPRVLVVGTPFLPKFMRDFSHNFNALAFQMPALGSGNFGNATKDVIRGPGLNNWDLSVFKRIPLPGERVKMQFRAEFYNAFNHTQFTTLDNTARFDRQGNQLNNRFGEFTAARPPRRVQLALRLNF